MFQRKSYEGLVYPKAPIVAGVWHGLGVGPVEGLRVLGLRLCFRWLVATGSHRSFEVPNSREELQACARRATSSGCGGCWSKEACERLKKHPGKPLSKEGLEAAALHSGFCRREQSGAFLHVNCVHLGRDGSNLREPAKA